MYRTPKRMAWYNQAKDRCVTQTLTEEQCSFSATYQAVDKEDVLLCKPHADMWALNEGPVRPIPDLAPILIRPERFK